MWTLSYLLRLLELPNSSANSLCGVDREGGDDNNANRPRDFLRKSTSKIVLGHNISFRSGFIIPHVFTARQKDGRRFGTDLWLYL